MESECRYLKSWMINFIDFRVKSQLCEIVEIWKIDWPNNIFDLLYKYNNNKLDSWHGCKYQRRRNIQSRRRMKNKNSWLSEIKVCVDVLLKLSGDETAAVICRHAVVSCDDDESGETWRVNLSSVAVIMVHLLSEMCDLLYVSCPVRIKCCYQDFNKPKLQFSVSKKKSRGVVALFAAWPEGYGSVSRWFVRRFGSEQHSSVISWIDITSV